MITNEAGQTCAMLWISERQKEVPEYLWHDPSIADTDGMTCAMYWRTYCDELAIDEDRLPEYTKC